MLTEKQRKTMLFIEAYHARTGGVSPTVREIAQHLGYRSKCSAHGLLLGLEDRGFIRCMPSRWRAIQVVTPISRFEFLRFDDQSKALRPYACAPNAEKAQVSQT